MLLKTGVCLVELVTPWNVEVESASSYNWMKKHASESKERIYEDERGKTSAAVSAAHKTKLHVLGRERGLTLSPVPRTVEIQAHNSARSHATDGDLGLPQLPTSKPTKREVRSTSPSCRKR